MEEQLEETLEPDDDVLTEQDQRAISDLLAEINSDLGKFGLHLPEMDWLEGEEELGEVEDIVKGTELEEEFLPKRKEMQKVAVAIGEEEVMIRSRDTGSEKAKGNNLQFIPLRLI